MNIEKSSIYYGEILKYILNCMLTIQFFEIYVRIIIFKICLWIMQF